MAEHELGALERQVAVGVRCDISDHGHHMANSLLLQLATLPDLRIFGAGLILKSIWHLARGGEERERRRRGHATRHHYKCIVLRETALPRSASSNSLSCSQVRPDPESCVDSNMRTSILHHCVLLVDAEPQHQP